MGSINQKRSIRFEIGLTGYANLKPIVQDSQNELMLRN